MSRMHELLGVEPFEVFEFETFGEYTKYHLDAAGNVFREVSDHKKTPSPREVVEIVNNPERIVRKPRLTDNQTELLNAGCLLGFRYLTKDEDGEMMMHATKPERFSTAWYQQTAMMRCAELDSDSPLAVLVRWTDREPLDIMETIKNGEYRDRARNVLRCPDCGGIIHRRYDEEIAMCSWCGKRFDKDVIKRMRDAETERK